MIMKERCGFIGFVPILLEGKKEPPLPLPCPFYSLSTPVCGKQALGKINLITKELCGFSGPHFYRDVYRNNIFVLPNLIDLGFVSGKQVVKFIVYNTFEETKTLTDIAETKTKGLEITGPTAGQRLGGFGATWDYTLTTGITDFIIDADFDFEFEGYVANLSVIGTQGIIWSFMPQSEFTEKFNWLTDVQLAYNKEHRVQLRENPSVSTEYKYQFNNEQYTSAIHMLKNMMQNILGVPDWNYIWEIGDVKQGTLEFDIVVKEGALRQGDMFIVWERADNYDILLVNSVTPHKLTSKSPTRQSYKQALLAPIRMSRILNRVALESGNFKNLASTKISFYQDSTYSLKGYAQEPLTYKGSYVYEDSNHLEGTYHEGIERELQIFDNQISPLSVTPVRSQALMDTILTLKPIDRQGLFELKTFLHFMRGRLIAAWFPSFKNNYTLLEDVHAGVTVLKCKNTDSFKLAKFPFEIIIETVQGKRYYRSVISSIKDFQGYEALTLDRALEESVNVMARDVCAVSILTLYRFSSDSVTINHDGNGNHTCKIPLLEVLHED